jgi:50S ribosomal protein L16 3-hydroxylase
MEKQLSPAEHALREAAREYHRSPTRGKIAVTPTKPLSNQRDLSLIEGAPLKILRHFRAQQDLHMQVGDLIYLPPGYAHHGTAVGECLTWSVGMRAPHRREVTARFLDYLQDRVCADDVYRDPTLKPQAHRAEIGPHMRKAARDMIGLLRWRDADIDRCFGEMLSEPRQNVVFDPPPRGSEQVFARRCRARGLELDLKSRMLFDHRNLYINGEATALRGHDAAVLRQLADQRALPPGIELATATRALLYRWYCAGYLAPPA